MRFEGILPAVTTPFDAAGDVDADALAANVAALLDAGVHGLVATGTMGEAGSLSRGERRDVVAVVAGAPARPRPRVARGPAGPPPAAGGPGARPGAGGRRAAQPP